MPELYSQLRTFGHVKLNEPMSKHTTLKIGGPVDFFLTIDSTEKVAEALKFLDGEGVPYFIVGGGSNMLVHDEGYHGVAIKILDSKFQILDSLVEASAGCITVEIAQKSIAGGLTGFEWGVGVPGTIGGAVRGNAGAMGGEMKDAVEEVEVYRNGEIEKLGNEECKFGYRDSVFKHEGGVVLRVRLRLRLREPNEMGGMRAALENLQYRNKTQPQGYASIGCIFKNLEFGIWNLENDPKFQILNSRFQIPAEFIKRGKISVGWLVEQAGMKGVRVGNAQVSERHGNFIVNLGGATANDVIALIAQVKEKVYDRCGVEIEEEIQII